MYIYACRGSSNARVHRNCKLQEKRMCWMEGFIDIHTHILPEVDDGARDISEACRMIRMAWKNGTRALVLTPHYRGAYKKNKPVWLREYFDALRRMMEQELPEMKLYLGNEIFYEKDAPEKLRAGEILSLNDTRYALLEFSSVSLRSQVVNGVTDMIYCGYIPVIAHVERYDIFHKDPGLIDEVLRMGAMIQVNAESIMGSQGLRIKHYCHTLLRDRKVHFVASDSHRVDKRPPLLSQCYEKVKKKYGREYAAQVFYKNARAILEDREL